MSSSVKLKGGGAFFADARAQVDAYLAGPAVRRNALRALWTKTAIGFVLLVGSWVALVFFADSPLEALPELAALLSGAVVFSVCVLHDANHGAFFHSKRTNYLLGWSVDVFLGFSSYFWRQKHTAHHSYPNIIGLDHDIDHAPLARMSDKQPYRRWYRWQHLYLWSLYGLALLRWHLTDLWNLRSVRSGDSVGRPPARGEIAGVILGKLLFVTWVFGIPLYRHSLESVMLCYLGLTIACSFVMAFVFQMAHCLDSADFLTPDEVRREGTLWAVQEVQSTADFCQSNGMLTWMIGALNFQIEHHLFPRLPHVLYPRIAPIVRQCAVEHGVRYVAYPTLRGALRSHYQEVRRASKRGDRVELEMG